MLAEENFSASNLEKVDRLSKGVERLTSGGIDAVLLDLGLPDSQGLSTFTRIQTVAQKIPILILTSFTNDIVALEAVRLGAQDYLIKGKTDGALLTRAINYAVERKKADEAVKRQAELIDLSPDAIIIKKPDDAITFWSLGAEKLYGWTKEEAIGQKTLKLFKTKSPVPIQVIDQQLREKGKWSGELIHHTKLGREVAIQSYWLAKLEHSEITEIFESNVDITERKNAERLAAIGATAGMVGHDIRNPLQTVIGEVFLAKCELKNLPDSQEKQNLQESLNTIEEQTTYVNKIVSDLQDFAKPLSPKTEQTDLAEIIHYVLSNLKIPPNVKVEQSVKKEFPKLAVDKTYLQRILQNLITNALQAMPNGGKLTVTASTGHAKAVIAVEDTGEGIPLEVRSKLFTPLITTKSKGQGFGLAVVKRFTEAMNGTITFESELGKGTKFTIELPF
jgi:two-component system, cell cycle sensor histidine kinase and response regulator CckA